MESLENQIRDLRLVVLDQRRRLSRLEGLVDRPSLITVSAAGRRLEKRREEIRSCAEAKR